MSLLAYIAHTGARLEANTSGFTSLDNFRDWVAQQSDVPASRQILMTSRGRIVKYQTLFSEHEVFVYDRSLFAAPARSSLPLYIPLPLPDPPNTSDPPDTLQDESSLDAWKTLFQQRREWSQQVVREASGRIAVISKHDEEIATIIRATAIATERVSGNSGGLQSSLQEAQEWSVGVLREPGYVLQNWDRTLKQLSSIDADPVLLRFLRPPGDPPESGEQPRAETTFNTLISKPDANRAASRGKQAMKWLEGQLKELDTSYQTLLKDSSGLVADFKAEQNRLGERAAGPLADLSEEMQAVVHKIDTDCNHVLSIQEGSRSLAAISKSALMHTKNLLPSLVETMADIGQLQRSVVEQRNRASQLAIRYLQRVSSVESSFADLKLAVTQLEISDDDDRTALDTLTFIHQLPSLYGSLLVESIRRNEWAKKMTQDSSTLAEELAVHKDDEERRRKRWSKALEHYLNSSLLDNKAIGIEVNLTNQGHLWPKTVRSDLQAYLSLLERVGGLEQPMQELTAMVESLDAPSKQQARRSNAFKSGSIHEASFGRNSLLLRGEDEHIQTLQKEKSRLEDRLKGTESRIRKLEDLLHRQTQMTRPSGGSPRPSLHKQSSASTFPPVPLSPRGETLTYRPSPASSRRVSQNHTSEEKALVQRILQLEADLETERNKVTDAQQSVADQKKAHDEVRQQLEETASMKNDLMDNFEAQQVEFDGDRRLLSEENRNLKIKVEELEEELDRLAGSYDNRVSIAERNQTLEAEIESLRKDAKAEYETLQAHVKSLQESHEERTQFFESQNLQHREEKQKMQAELTTLHEEVQVFKDERNDHRTTLEAMYRELGRDEPLPGDFEGLMATVDAIVRRAAAHTRELQVTLDRAKAENDAGAEHIRNLGGDLSEARGRADVSEQALDTLRGELDDEKSRFGVLKDELEEERSELRKLRALVSDGESGSEALRTRVSDEERKVEELGQQVATSKNRSRQLEEMLSQAQKEFQQLEDLHHSRERLIENTSKRAEEISQLLFLQTDRLTHLLEHCGFSVSREEEVMVIQRVSRSGSTGKDSLVLGPTQSIDRTPSGPLPTLAVSEPPEYIHWALAGDEKLATQQFAAFRHESKAFDMDAFCDAIVRRIKDIEHLARKWQREAKNYRDRFHRAQFDSQHKIAFRGFREGDLALFLPTRNQAPKRSWAAFNVGAPHYFLREEESHRLNTRDWLLARISKVEERVVDLSKHNSRKNPRHLLSPPGTEQSQSEEENPFGLSDGLRWYYLDAAEEKIGAPSTPGLAKTTVASAHVDAAGSIPRKEKPDETSVTRTLAKSLDSRRSSGNSRKSLIGAAGTTGAPATGTAPGASSDPPASGLKDVERAKDDGDKRGSAESGRPVPEDTDPSTSTQPRDIASASGVTSSSQASQPHSSVKSKAWDALWSLDLNLDGKGKSKK